MRSPLFDLGGCLSAARVHRCGPARGAGALSRAERPLTDPGNDFEMTPSRRLRAEELELSQSEILKARVTRPMSRLPTLREAMLAVAAEGGHIKAMAIPAGKCWPAAT